jgi:hypothetical protein
VKLKINGYADGGKFGNLEKILWSWVKLNEQFFIQSRDGSWWYNERASISILAAAAWMAGGIALEEFSAKKKQKKVERSGRADVYFNLRGREFACEAKFIWLSIKSRNPIDQINAELKNAYQDAGCLNRKEGRRFGVCFATIYVSEKDAGQLDALLSEFQKKISSENFAAIAWSFPAGARKLEFKKSSMKHKYFYPGSFIVFRKYD